jgi:flagellar hook-basal body complex protein FliE
MATDGNDFGRVLDAAKNMIKETNDLQNAAQMEEMKFALGLADNTHDVMIAERKAQVALNYTVAVRDRFLQSYQTIMNMQI